MQKRTLSIAGILIAISGLLFGTNTISFKKEISFSGTSSIEGTITDADVGNYLVHAEISIEGSNTVIFSDSNGYYQFQNLEAGAYKLIYEATNYETVEREIKINEGEKKTIDIQCAMQMFSLKEEDSKMERKIKDASKNSKPDVLSIESYSVSDEPALYGYFDQEEYPSNYNTESYNTIQENGFRNVFNNPLSTFSIDVDNASYANIRRFISYGQTPPKDAVRIEEMLNYFDYTYAQPKGDDPFAINTEISTCPWNENNKLIMIGMQGKDIDYSKAAPSNLVFLIDVSGSMSDVNKLPLVKKSLEFLIDHLNEKDKVAIVVYAGAAGAVLPSTSAINKQKIKDALNNLSSGGSTAGGEGIILAYKIAQENFIQEGNNRVVLCTDGDFNTGTSSDAEMTRLIEEKRKSGVFITVCGFGMGNYKDSKLESIADNGNGSYYYIDDEKEAKKVFITDMKGTLFTIAKDVKIQIEFNPTKVKEYRLIGYENRILNNEDFNNDAKDAGELGAGHRVTALYEVVLQVSDNYEPSHTENTNSKEVDHLKYQTTSVKELAYYSNDIMHIKLRYKKPDAEVSKFIETTIMDQEKNIASTSDNFRFACAVVEFGMLLRQSEFKGDATYEEVVKLANSAKGQDTFGYRKEFIDMVQTFLGFAQK